MRNTVLETAIVELTRCIHDLIKAVHVNTLVVEALRAELALPVEPMMERKCNRQEFAS